MNCCGVKIGRRDYSAELAKLQRDLSQAKQDMRSHARDDGYRQEKRELIESLILKIASVKRCMEEEQSHSRGSAGSQSASRNTSKSLDVESISSRASSGSINASRNTRTSSDSVPCDFGASDIVYRRR